MAKSADRAKSAPDPPGCLTRTLSAPSVGVSPGSGVFLNHEPSLRMRRRNNDPAVVPLPFLQRILTDEEAVLGDWNNAEGGIELPLPFETELLVSPQQNRWRPIAAKPPGTIAKG